MLIPLTSPGLLSKFRLGHLSHHTGSVISKSHPARADEVSISSLEIERRNQKNRFKHYTLSVYKPRLPRVRVSQMAPVRTNLSFDASTQLLIIPMRIYSSCGSYSMKAYHFIYFLIYFLKLPNTSHLFSRAVLK